MASITYEEFTEACSDFLKLSEKLGDTWKAENDVQEEGAFYLRKTQCVGSSSGQEVEGEASGEEGDDHCCEEPEPPDPSLIGGIQNQEIITYEYHIVYSLSHSVPTLYFNAWHSSGKLLTLEEVWERVNIKYNEQIINNKWESLTQVEHPLLGRPFYQLHPCKTAQLMGQVLPQHRGRDYAFRNYIISWLSMFGAVVGLELPLGYFEE